MREAVAMDFAKRFRVDPADFSLADRQTEDDCGLDKAAAKQIRDEDIAALGDLQERLYAEHRQSLLVVLQALDAAGKDSTIEHVMTGVNPQGVRVVSFKQPSELELSHNFLWRCQLAAPSRGEIAIFNRSHYEDVLVVRVHPDLLAARGIDPARGRGDALWNTRFEAIRNWERQLTLAGTTIVKFFLHVSKEEQRERFLARIDRPEKHWKFSPSDVREREHYDDYQRAYDAMLRATATDSSPWYVIPADQKWLMRAAVASIIRGRLEAMDPQYPELSPEDLGAMRAEGAKLRAEL